MQITVKTSKCLTKGTNDYGPWALYKIVATDEKIYTTLADGADVLKPGAIFEPSDVMLGDIKNEVQEFKFKKFTLVTASSAPPPPGPTRETSPEEWKEKQLIERASFEAQTAYKGAIELLAARGMAEEGKELIEAALVWGIKRLNPTLQEALTTMPHLARPEDQKERKTVKPGEPHFENPGQLFEKTNKYGVMRGDILKRYSISEKEVSKINPDEMWDQLVTDGVIVIKEE